jgi:nucleoside-diphosphate-sugar epimerase
MTLALVTGASGFVGGHLVESLVRRGFRVRCLVRATSSLDLLDTVDAELVQGDLSDGPTLERAVAGTDVVFHVAGLTAALRAEDFLRVNAHGTAHVARACAACPNPPVHVLVSSVAAVGPARRHRPRRESDPVAPVSTYGRSKLAGERFAQRWARRVPTTIVRPGVVFGPRNRELLPTFWGIHRWRFHFIPTWFWPPLSMIHVEDLVEILVRAFQSGQRLVPSPDDAEQRGRGCYFACADEYPDYVQLGRMALRAMGGRHMVVMPLVTPLPWMLAGAVQLGGQIVRRPGHLNLDKIREACAESWACSTEATRQDLQFTAPPLAERLQSTIDWYFEEGWL